MEYRSWRSWLKSMFSPRGGATIRHAAKHGAPNALRLEELEQRVVPASTLSVGNESFNLAAGATGFQVTRTGDLTPVIDIGYSILSGSATSGTNYTSTAPTGVLHFNSEQTTATIPLSILSNNFAQLGRNFSIDLTGVVDAFGPPATFAAQQTYATQSSPVSVTVADLNGDGRQDLIVANSASNTVSVLMGMSSPGGNPGFSLAQTFATGTDPVSVAAADLNGDGELDIIVANEGSNTVSVLMNTSQPGSFSESFAPQQTFATGSSPDSVAVADVNGDGSPDIIVANSGSNNVSVLMNTTATGATTAGFAAQQTFATGSNPVSVISADVNGDGRPDIIVANESSNTVSVLLNSTAPGSATASFAGQAAFATGTGPDSVAAADVNGDGMPDLIVANSVSNTVSVLLNTASAGAGSAAFAGQQAFAVGSDPSSVAAVDVNNDGRPDIVVANQGANTLSVLTNSTVPGASTASFSAQQTYAAGNSPQSIAALTLTGDGMPALIVANSGSDTVSVLANTTSHSEVGSPGVPTPTFPQTATATGGNSPDYVTLADLNGDGKLDVIVTNSASNTISVLMNTTAPGASTQTFSAPETFATGTGPDSVTVADLNGDGLLDLIVANSGSNTVSVLMNTTAPGASTASFADEETFAVGTDPVSVTTADLNGDGEPDIIVANSGSNTVSVLMNTTAIGASTASFAGQQTFATGTAPDSVAAADVNGDGIPDIIVANSGSDTVSVLLNTTAPGAAAPTFANQQTFATGDDPVSLAMADVNGDGKPDIIVANENSNTVSVLTNDTGPGATVPSFSTQQTFATGHSPESVAVADVNGDGRLDIIVANNGSNTVSVLYNTTPTGVSIPSFATQQTFATGNGPSSVAVADMNGDGWPDLVVANNSGNTISALLNTPAVIGANPATGTIYSAPVVQSFDLTDVSPSNAGVVQFTVTFSEAVSGVSAGNFILTGTGATGLLVGTPTTSDGGITWIVPISTNNDGTLGLTLNNRSGIVDSNGNQLYDTTSDNGSVFSPIASQQLYVIDKTPPVPSFTGTPASVTNSTSATFAFTATDPEVDGVSSGVAYLQYSLDGAPYTVGGSPQTFNNLAYGPHTFAVEAVDNAGNVSTPTTYGWTITSSPINTPPSITTNPTNSVVLEGSTVTFTAAASGTPTPTVQWQVSTNGGGAFANLSNGSLYSGVTTNTLTVSGVTLNMSGYEYRAVYTNGIGSPAQTTAAVLTVNYHSQYAAAAYNYSYAAYIYAYDALASGLGSYDVFLYAYYAQFYAQLANSSASTGSAASAEYSAYYAYYYGYYGQYYAYLDYAHSGGASIYSYYAYYDGYFGETYSYYTALGE